MDGRSTTGSITKIDSNEWKDRNGRRGLPNLTTSVDEEDYCNDSGMCHQELEGNKEYTVSERIRPRPDSERREEG